MNSLRIDELCFIFVSVAEKSNDTRLFSGHKAIRPVQVANVFTASQHAARC